MVRPFGIVAPSCLSVGLVVSVSGHETAVDFAAMDQTIGCCSIGHCFTESADCRGFTIDLVVVAWSKMTWSERTNGVVGSAGLLDQWNWLRFETNDHGQADGLIDTLVITVPGSLLCSYQESRTAMSKTTTTTVHKEHSTCLKD